MSGPNENSALGLLPFSKAAEIWLDQHSRYIKPGSIKTYREYFKALHPFFGELRVNTISIAQIRGFQDERRKAAGASRINKELSAVHQVLAEAGCWESIRPLYKPLRLSAAKSGHSLTPAEESRLREIAFTQPRWQLAAHCMIVMLSTTAGFGELRHLRRGDVDLEQRSIHIQEGVKNEYRDRTIPLNSAAFASMTWILERWQRLGGTSDDHFILPHRSRVENGQWIMDEPMTAIRTAFEKIRKAAGLPKFRVYDCRVQAITKILSDPKVSSQVAKEIAGHISQAMQSRYSIQLLDTKRAALDALEPASMTPEVLPAPDPVIEPARPLQPGAFMQDAIQAEIARQVALAMSSYAPAMQAQAENATMPRNNSRLIMFPSASR